MDGISVWKGFFEKKGYLKIEHDGSGSLYICRSQRFSKLKNQIRCFEFDQTLLPGLLCYWCSKKILINIYIYMYIYTYIYIYTHPSGDFRYFNHFKTKQPKPDLGGFPYFWKHPYSNYPNLFSSIKISATGCNNNKPATTELHTDTFCLFIGLCLKSLASLRCRKCFGVNFHQVAGSCTVIRIVTL